MATIEKEKALDVVRQMVADGQVSQEVAEKYFPELAESEDEKIRKELLDFCKNRAEKYHNDPKYKNISAWIAWLEKQDVRNLDTDFSELRTWKYIVDAVWTEKEGVGQYLDSPFTEEVAKKLQKRFGDIEQKPEWSKEDEAHLDSLLKRLEGICKPGAAFISTRFAISEDKYWLKTLKDRYTWKPTKEQMKFLYKYAEQNNYDGAILTSLYNDLKQLKERVSLKRIKI